MGSIFASSILLFHVLLVLMCVNGGRDLEITKGALKVDDKHDMDGHLRNFADQEEDNHGYEGMHVEATHHHMMRLHGHDHPSSQMDQIDPTMRIFFTVSDLKIGKTIPTYFLHRDPSTSTHLLPRETSNSIPFSLLKLQYLLEFFSFSKDSPQAKAIEGTLRHCEIEPLKGETKFCATSLESMLDSTRGVFGLDTKFKLLTTKHLTKPTKPFQNYTILEEPLEILASRVVACHTMPYPYAVFYCHSQESDNRVFEVALEGEYGDRIQALSICHMDTSQWDPNHVAFSVLKVKPGGPPVCHFFPADNLVWIPSI